MDSSIIAPPFRCRIGYDNTSSIAYFVKTGKINKPGTSASRTALARCVLPSARRPDGFPLPGSLPRAADHLRFLKARTRRSAQAYSSRLSGQRFQAGSFIRPVFILAAHHNPAAIPDSFRKQDAGGCCSCGRRHHQNAA